MMLIVRTLREDCASLPSQHHAERSWLLSEAPSTSAPTRMRTDWIGEGTLHAVESFTPW
jgi:hypothetical protein